MDWPAPFLNLLRLALLLSGMLLPGLLALRAFGLPRSLGLGFLVSSAVHFAGVLVLALTHSPVNLATLAAGPVAVSLGSLVVLARWRDPGRAGEGNWLPWWGGLGGWLPLLLLPAGIVAYRLLTDPLSGPDVHFRWSYLAEQMLRHRTLDFYPIVSAEDHLRYFWPESIPPGIASLYAWCYACGGGLTAGWTTPVVALQFLALFEFVWALADSWGGREAARRALLLAGACPLLLWSGLLGQETGLLAVSVTALVLCLGQHARTGSDRWLLPAAASALVAASTREYGFIFAGIAALHLGFTSAWRPPARRFALLVLPAVTLWPAYCWGRTGNPFYSLDLGGIFPVSPVFLAWNRAFLAGHQDVVQNPGSWPGLIRYLLVWALPACVGLAALGRLLRQRTRGLGLLAILAGVSTGLWLLSIPYTAGGLFYTLRVLSPAFALLVVAAGVELGRWNSTRASRWRAVLTALLLLESLPKTLVLPDNPYRVPAAHWLEAGREITTAWHSGEEAMLRKIADIPRGHGIVSDNFDLPRLAAGAGRTVAPLWSPAFAWFFDRRLSEEEAARRWRDSGIRVLIIGQTGPTLAFLQHSGRWTSPYYSVGIAASASDHLFVTLTPTGRAAP